MKLERHELVEQADRKRLRPDENQEHTKQQ